MRRLQLLTLVLISSLAHADDCDRARLAATAQCKQHIIDSMPAISRVAKQGALKASKNRTSKIRVFREFAEASMKISRQTIQLCRNTVPACSKACDGDANYCSDPIEAMVRDIDSGVRDGIKKGFIQHGVPLSEMPK